MLALLNGVRWGLVALLAVLIVAPSAWLMSTQQRFIEVDGASMSPTFLVGDIVLVGAPTPKDFAVGKIVTIRARNGTLYTHRIVSAQDGQAELKGDANRYADPQPVTYDAVVGVVRNHLSGPAAHVMRAIQPWRSRCSLFAVVLGLVFLPTKRRTRQDRGAAQAASDD